MAGTAATQRHGRTCNRPTCFWLALQVPLRRIVALNKPELPAAVTGLTGSAALGMMMPGGQLLHAWNLRCLLAGLLKWGGRPGAVGAHTLPCWGRPRTIYLPAWPAMWQGREPSIAAGVLHPSHAGFSLAFSSMLSVFYNPDPCECSALLVVLVKALSLSRRCLSRHGVLLRVRSC